MNGYSLSQFPDFIKKWHFVTVRYRKDAHEMRFSYANDKAWETLQAGAKKYPDGAVFAKLGIMTQEDLAFSASATWISANEMRPAFLRTTTAAAGLPDYGFGIVIRN